MKALLSLLNLAAIVASLFGAGWLLSATERSTVPYTGTAAAWCGLLGIILLWELVDRLYSRHEQQAKRLRALELQVTASRGNALRAEQSAAATAQKLHRARMQLREMNQLN